MCGEVAHNFQSEEKKFMFQVIRILTLSLGLGLLEGWERIILYILFLFFLKRVTNDYFYVTRDLFLVR